MTPVAPRPTKQFPSFSANTHTLIKPLDLRKVKIVQEKEDNSKPKLDASLERRLQHDAIDSPNSKLKYKNIAKTVDELEKSEVQFKDLVKMSLDRMLDAP